MNFKFHFKMFVCKLISANKVYWSIFSPKSSSKYPTNVFPVTPLNSFQKYCPDISPVTPLKFFSEILPRYFPSDPLQVLSRNTAQIFHRYISKYFPLEKYLQNHFQVPTNIFFITFLMLIRICMPPVSYGELCKLISLIQDKSMLISH
jgi:hypothetical protein